MPEANGPRRLLPGDELTLHDVQRLLPCAVRLDGNKLVVTRSIRFRRAPLPPPAPPKPIVPWKER